VYIDFVVLKLLTEPHPTGHVCMIFKLLYTTIYYFLTVTAKNTELSWMK
jgi:hypothetical protein